MSTSLSTPNPDTSEIVTKIISESRRRPLVPFMGAGISLSAGFPTIKFVIQYLAKVTFAIRLGVYESRLPRLHGGATAVDMYQRHPSKYLEDFGWPDLGQLNADLWTWLGRDQDGERKTFNGLGRERIWKDSSARQAGQAGERGVIVDLLANDVTRLPLLQGPHLGDGSPIDLDLRDHLFAIVQWTLRQDVADREGGTRRATLREWIRWKRWYRGRIANRPALLYGDWEAFLDKLCEGSFDLSDLLFTSIELGRQPTMSHRYLAFLQRKLDIPLFLTTNFDSLLERAFREEEIPHKVFDVHRDADLPDPALVRRQLSVLKLHGSAYGLRLGERLKYPLEAQAKYDAIRYFPPDALILVMGFSGSERRIMQLLHAVVHDQALGTGTPRLIWLQGPGSPGPLVAELTAARPDAVVTCKIANVDTFMQELHGRLTSSYQASRIGYSALPTRPQHRQSQDAGPSAAATGEAGGRPPASTDRDRERRPVQLFLNPASESGRSTSWASMSGAAFVDTLDYGYNAIWIDLETHHTVEGIIAEFFAKVRLVDPHAPTVTVTDLNADPMFAIAKAVARMREVFQRGQYALVLDSVESFGRPQMMHHGIPSFRLYADNPDLKDRYQQLIEEFRARVDNLCAFLKSLLMLPRAEPPDNRAAQGFWDSYVVVTVDRPRLRHARGTGGNGGPDTLQEVKKLTGLFTDRATQSLDHVRVHVQDVAGYADLLKLPNGLPPTVDLSALPAHWGGQPAASSKNGIPPSVLRAGDVLRLIHELRSRTGKDQSLSQQAAAAFVAVMGVFRRPRTIPMLRSIIDRWVLRRIDSSSHETGARFAHEAVDRLLPDLAGLGQATPVGVVAQIHEGRSVWLFREVHEATYDAFTALLHARDWIGKWGDDPVVHERAEMNPAHAIIDGLVVVALHFFAARTYYADVYLPTRDVNAFYEYIYHRVASLRATTLLMAILTVKDPRADDLWSDLRRLCEQALDPFEVERDAAEAVDAVTRFAHMVGVFTPVKHASPLTSPGKLFKALGSLRQHGLETLLMALRRNHRELRSVATPDTLLAWSRQFVNRELDEIQGLTYRLGGPKAPGAKSSLSKRVAPLGAARDACDALRHRFEALQAEALMGKLDFIGTFLSVCESTPKPAAVGATLDDDFVRKKIKHWLDRVSTRAKSFAHVADDVSRLLWLLRCLVHWRHSTTRDTLDALIDRLRDDLRSDLSAESRAAAKTHLGRALEISCRSRFERALFWMTLLERRRGTESDLQQPLGDAEEESEEYEAIIRETTDRGEDDSRKRSAALTMRARSLYLRGFFRQAHHCLDLATAGLSSDRVEHRAAGAVVELHRAELLAISAHEHYCTGSVHDHLLPRPGKAFKTFGELAHGYMLPSVDASLRKIGRAEQELGRAQSYLRGAAHLNIWAIPVEFGVAQLNLERLLYESEAVFWAARRLSETDYLRRSGTLERVILDGMRHLRAVLDIIPYTADPWAVQCKRIDRTSSMIGAERMVYRLWMQYFVAGAHHSSLLYSYYTDDLPRPEMEVGAVGGTFIPGRTGMAITGATATPFLDTWRQWCAAMRFEHFGEHVDLKVALQRGHRKAAGESFPYPSLRATMIGHMADASADEAIDEMWNVRREKMRAPTSANRG